MLQSYDREKKKNSTSLEIVVVFYWKRTNFSGYWMRICVERIKKKKEIFTGYYCSLTGFRVLKVCRSKCESINSNIFLAPHILYNIQYLLHDRFPWKKMKIKRKPIFYLERRNSFHKWDSILYFQHLPQHWVPSFYSQILLCFTVMSCHVISTKLC